jgi:hypothetical protein
VPFVLLNFVSFSNLHVPQERSTTFQATTKLPVPVLNSSMSRRNVQSVVDLPHFHCDNGKVLPAFVLDLFQHLAISSHLRISHFRLGVTRANKAASRPILEIE